MGPQLSKEISEHIRLLNDKETSVRIELLQELPPRLKKRLSVYFFNSYKMTIEFL